MAVEGLKECALVEAEGLKECALVQVHHDAHPLPVVDKVQDEVRFRGGVQDQQVGPLDQVVDNDHEEARFRSNVDLQQDELQWQPVTSLPVE